LDYFSISIFCQHNAYAPISSNEWDGNSGRIPKKVMENSDLICIGEIKEIRMEKTIYQFQNYMLTFILKNQVFN